MSNKHTSSLDFGLEFERKSSEWNLELIICHLLETKIRPRNRLKMVDMLIENSFNRIIFSPNESTLLGTNHLDFDTEDTLTTWSMKKIRFARDEGWICLSSLVIGSS